VSAVEARPRSAHLQTEYCCNGDANERRDRVAEQANQYSGCNQRLPALVAASAAGAGNDTFIVRWTDRQLNADAFVSFTLSPQRAVEQIRMKALSPTTDFSYDFHDLDLERYTPP
jgi:ABC-type uncharacterized transport system involved in gliding motility auxiliary subunit